MNMRFDKIDAMLLFDLYLCCVRWPDMAIILKKT